MADDYRSTLQMCEEYVETRDKLARLEIEIRNRTEKSPEEFLDGMRRLFAPMEKPDLDNYTGFAR